MKFKKKKKVKYWQVQALDEDMTFIMKQTNYEGKDEADIEVCGYYWGEPSEDGLQAFKNKRKGKAYLE